MLCEGRFQTHIEQSYFYHRFRCKKLEKILKMKFFILFAIISLSWQFNLKQADEVIFNAIHHFFVILLIAILKLINLYPLRAKSIVYGQVQDPVDNETHTILGSVAFEQLVNYYFIQVLVCFMLQKYYY